MIYVPTGIFASGFLEVINEREKQKALLADQAKLSISQSAAAHSVDGALPGTAGKENLIVGVPMDKATKQSKPQLGKTLAVAETAQSDAYDGEDNEENADDAPQLKSKVVLCPHCQTKFLVDNEQLAKALAIKS